MHGKLSAVAILSVSAMLAQPAAAQTPAIDQLPAALKPAGLAVYLEVPATGVQIYTCGKNNAGAWAWNFKGPEAELFDTQKKSIGKHYGGPTWEGADGGKVVGAMKANAPAPGGSSIPWLLLDIKSSEGSGQFAQAKGICGSRPPEERHPPRAAMKRTPTRKAASRTRRPTCS